jgi:hypothetical protein
MHFAKSRPLNAAVLAFLLSIAAVTTAEAGKPAPPMPTPGPDQALIFVDRENGLIAMAQPYDVWLDGKSIATLGNASYTWVVVPVGLHSVTVAYPFCAIGPVTVARELSGGEAIHYHIQLTGGMGGRQYGWQLQPQDSTMAEQDRYRHRYVPSHLGETPDPMFSPEKCHRRF